VEIVKVEVTCAAPGVIVGGEKLQKLDAGSPEQESAIGALKDPILGVSATV